MTRPPRVVGGRRTYDALARSPLRARRGPVAVHFLEDDDGVRRFAYSVGRRVGGSVRRNRCRRRLRAIASEVADRFPPGAYLIGLAPEAGTMSFPELRRRVIEALEDATKARP